MSLRRHSRWPLAALSLAMLLPSLGTSIANVALPTLAAAFRAPVQEVQWVVIAYLLAVTTLVVVAGRLGDMFGRRRLLLAGIAIFALASAGGMLAPNLWVLVTARGAQGVGAALMMALSVASVGDMVPRDRTGSAMGLLGTVSAVGTALGPSLGGVLVSSLGWPAAFAFMTVAGAVALAVGHRVLPAEAPATQKRSPLDVPGVLLLAVALGAYALATTLDQFTGVLGIVAAIGFVAFVVVEARAASPLVQMALFRDGALSAELAAMGLVSAILMATLVVGPFYLSESLGLDPVGTGLVMSVGPAVVALAGVPAGRLTDRLGASAVALAGLTGVAAGSVAMAMLPAVCGVGGYVGSLVLITAGYALFQAGNNTAVMRGAAQERRGVISALLALARNLGLITGASAMGAILPSARVAWSGSMAAVRPGCN